MATTAASDLVNLTEALADFVLEEDNRGRLTALNLFNMYSIAGLKTDTKKLRRWDDPGVAGTATQGTAFTTTTQLGQTAVSATPTEAAVQMALVTNDAIELQTGIESAAEFLRDAPFDMQFRVLAPFAQLLGRSLFEKAEVDAVTMYASLSRNGGPSSGSDLALSNFDSTLLTLESGEDLPHDDIVADLDKEQHGNLRTELMVTSGGVAGTIWTMDLASIAAHRRGLPGGAKGALLGVPVYVHSTSARVTANAGADVVGAMYLRGFGAPEDTGQGQPGCFAHVEGRRIVFTIETDHRERGAEVQGNWKYAQVERVDNWGVKLVSDAP